MIPLKEDDEQKEKKIHQNNYEEYLCFLIDMNGAKTERS